VVLTDIRMPPTGTDEGIRAAEAIREAHPDIGVVVLSQYAEPDYALGFLQRGSEGRAYLLKERVTDVDQLRRAIVAVHEGGAVIDPQVADGVGARRPRPPPRPQGGVPGRPSPPARAGGVGRDGARQEQRRHRRLSGAH